MWVRPLMSAWNGFHSLDQYSRPQETALAQRVRANDAG